jgi:carboxymethylenebutenolidase
MATVEIAELKVPDGEMSTFNYKPEGSGKHPAVIVIQEIFGVNSHIKDVADRFAGQGYFAIAPDLFHRGGKHVTVEYANAPDGMALRGQIPDDGLEADLNAVVAYLKSQPDVDGDKIGIIGFCFGGRVAFYAAAKVPGIAATAVYYGGGIIPREGSPAGTPNLLDDAAAISGPVIGFFGDQDQAIPVEHVKEIEGTLKQLGKDSQINLYEGAGHGFFCDERGSYHEASAKDAWSKTTDFFAKNLKG